MHMHCGAFRIIETTASDKEDYSFVARIEIEKVQYEYSRISPLVHLTYDSQNSKEEGARWRAN